ncbi:MAG: ABC transporter substrate-binding protein [Acidimicrobiia bacterium]
MIRKYPRAVLGAAALVALIAAACGDDSTSSDTTTKPTAAAGATTAASSGGAATTAATGGTAARPTFDATKNTASGPGVTKDTITIGLITSVTGAAASTFVDTADGVKARIEAENAKGGVYGRQIKLEVGDDASSVQGDQTAAQSLIETKNSFVIIGYSPFLTGGYRYLQEKGIPVFGSGFDGPEWHQQPNTNMLSWSATSPTGDTYTNLGEFYKKIGATSVGTVAYGNSPSSTASIKAARVSIEAAGLKVGYENLSFPFGGTDFTAVALDMKKAGIDAAACSCVDSSNFAMFVALKQAGIQTKGSLAFSGPSNNAFATPTSTDAAEGQYFQSTQTPYFVENPGTKALVENLTKYASNSYKGGFATYGQSGGYVSADLMIEALWGAGQNPTRQQVLDAARKLTAYNGNGLLADTIDFSLSKFETQPDTACTYFTQIKDKKWILPFEKICGKRIPGSAPKA